MYKYDRLMPLEDRLKLRDKALKDYYTATNANNEKAGKEFVIRQLECNIHSNTPPTLTPDLYSVLVDYFTNNT